MYIVYEVHGFFPVVYPDEQQKGKSDSGPEMSAASGRKKKPKKDRGKVNPKGKHVGSSTGNDENGKCFTFCG